MKRIAHLFFLFPLLASACSFDGFFLQPERIALDADSIRIHDPFADECFQVGLNDDLSPVFPESRKVPYKIESVRFENGSGDRLHAWTLSPPDTVKPNGITLFVLHGNAGNITAHFGSMKPYLQRGFKAFIFDYSGYGFSEGEPSRSKLLPDSRAALDFLLGKEESKKEQVLIFGQSLGGHLAPTLALEYPDRVDGVIMEGSFSTPKKIASDKAGIFGRIFTSQEHTALASVQKLERPLLIVHGTKDKVVPFEQGKELYEHANEPKTFLRYEMGHLEGSVLHSDRIAAEMLKMVKER